MASLNINQPAFMSVESLTQSPTTASRVMIVQPTSQLDESVPLCAPGVLAEVAMSPMDYDPDISRPRVPGSAKGRILRIASDFDAPLR